MISQATADWLGQRGIKSDTATALGATTASKGGGDWIVLPYLLDGVVVNRKFRAIFDKRHALDKGGKLCLWNAAALRLPVVTEEGGSVVITEGEFDAMAAIQCGHAATCSVPNGAPTERIDDPVNANRYRFLYESQSDLELVKCFVLATDADGPGNALAYDMAAILGPERCKFVRYPEGCKDLNEVLVAHGAEAVMDVIAKAKPFPIRGLHKFSDFPAAPPLRGMPTGIAVLDDMMQIVLGTLTVVTGYANSGKSSLLNSVIANCVAKGVPVCVASFETMPKPVLQDGIARALIGCTANEYENHPQKQAALDAIDDKVQIVSNALDEDLELDIDAFLDTVRVAVVRDGVKIIILDPWNEIEHKRTRNETLTEYVGRAIRRIKSFIRQYGVSFWIVAHPTKPIKGTNTIPSLYDISDSAAFSNKADYGVVYHRPDKAENLAKLAVVKVRMGLPGKCGVADVKFDHRTGRIAGFME